MTSLKKLFRDTGAMVALAMLLTGCIWGNKGGDDPKAVGPETNPQQVRKGDTLRITYFVPSIPSQVFDEQVKPDGKINVMHVGSLQVDGKTTTEIEQMITSKLVPDFFKSMTITVLPMEQYFSVGGQVYRGGQIRYSGRTTIMSAVQAAGDINEYANRHAIQITRANGRIEIVDYDEAKSNPSKDLEIFPHDYITVPKRF